MTDHDALRAILSEVVEPARERHCDRQAEPLDSLTLVQTLLALHTDWQQRDIARALCVTQGYISGVLAGKKIFRPGVIELGRYRIQDAIAHQVNGRCTYAEIVQLTDIYLRHHHDLVDGDGKLFEMARQLYHDGYVII